MLQFITIYKYDYIKFSICHLFTGSILGLGTFAVITIPNILLTDSSVILPNI